MVELLDNEPEQHRVGVAVLEQSRVAVRVGKPGGADLPQPHLQPVNPDNPNGQKYGYGIVQVPVGPNKLWFHNGELPGYNTFAAYDPVNRVTLIVWTTLPLSVDDSGPADVIAGKLAADIYRGVQKPVDPNVPGD